LTDEPLLLIDINICDAALAGIRKFKQANVHFLQLRSTVAANDQRLLTYKHKIRFVHIDGGHAAATVSNDLALAQDVICEEGIISVDDFFNSPPNPSFAKSSRPTACAEPPRISWPPSLQRLVRRRTAPFPADTNHRSAGCRFRGRSVDASRAP